MHGRATTRSRKRPAKTKTKREIMDDLLARLGNGQIDRDEFFRRLAQAGMNDDDIDRYCDGTLR